jgi:hypothetical protein
MSRRPTFLEFRRLAVACGARTWGAWFGPDEFAGIALVVETPEDLACVGRLAQHDGLALPEPVIQPIAGGRIVAAYDAHAFVPGTWAEALAFLNRRK